MKSNGFLKTMFLLVGFYCIRNHLTSLPGIPKLFLTVIYFSSEEDEMATPSSQLDPSRRQIQVSIKLIRCYFYVYIQLDGIEFMTDGFLLPFFLNSLDTNLGQQ